jgi:shikimate kinase/3-dehydroquinate synthase
LDGAPLFLIGFMAAGKSTVGPMIAELLGRRWVDLDARVEAAAGRKIPAIFEAEGEMGFRRREAQALREVCAERDVVVSCGGGAPVFGDNLARMRRAGVTASLLVGLDDVLRRADSSTRPLLAGGREQAERLLGERQEVYRSAEICVETGGRAPAEVAAELARRAPLHLGDVAVRLEHGATPIHLAPLARAGELLAELCPEARVAALVSDENVARAGHLARAASAVAGAGVRPVEIVIPPGEESKTLAQVERVASSCVAGGLDRRSAVLAVGGGVVGDLAGFAASMLYRGVACAQLPTTLLAMVDSSIGGKTGVDLPAGKNLVGAFWQPRFVLADVTTLATLPPRELAAAYAEVLKYGLLGDAALFEALERDGPPPAEGLASLVARCAAHKARVVAADERELTGARATLNLGHTFGHAVELASGYRLLHGEAVAVGLVAAAEVSARLGLAPVGLAARVKGALARCGLAAELDAWRRRSVVALAAADKKRQGGRIRFVALEDVGRTRLVELGLDELAAHLEVKEES